MIKIIVAHDKNMLIGMGSKLPWKIPEEIKHFKEEIDNKILVIGENTFLGLNVCPSGKEVIILSKNKEKFRNSNRIKILDSIDEIIQRGKKEDIYILGGRNVYEQFISLADMLIISVIDKEYEGDVYFPIWKKEDFVLKKVKKINDYINAYYYEKK